MDQKKTVLIIDDHPVLRECIKLVIGDNGPYNVIGEAENGCEGLKMSGELRPDLILIDISLPDQNGIQLTREIKTKLPDTRIVMMSLHSDMAHISGAFKAGAHGYIDKESITKKLHHAFNDVLEGKYFMDGPVAQKTVKRLMETHAEENNITNTSYDMLSPREQEIMNLLIAGLSREKIGEELDMSAETVEDNCAMIMDKLDVHSTSELICYAAQIGLIDPDPWEE